MGCIRSESKRHTCEAERSVLQHSFPVNLQGRQSVLYSASYLQFGLREAQRLLQRQLIARALMAETTEILEHPCALKLMRS